MKTTKFGIAIELIKQLIERLIPVGNGIFLFSSFDGHYSDSPKVLSEKLHELYPDYKITWLLQEKYFQNAPSYVSKININSFKAILYRGRAKVIVDNVYGHKNTELHSKNLKKRIRYRLESWLKIKSGQKLYTTWHGTPLKKMGRDQIGVNIYEFSCPETTMILPNRFTAEVMGHLTFDKVRMEVIGSPRNDILFSAEDKRLAIKKALGLPLNKKIVLFAPTFRTNSSDSADSNVERSGIIQIPLLKIDKLTDRLRRKFGGEWAVVCRFHYHVAEKVDWMQISETYKDLVINGNESDDMSLYLAVSDILITDASSCMFDFAITGRPCFLFFPDLSHYMEEERGIYIELDKLPFPISTEYEGLDYLISNFNEIEYKKKLDNMKKELGYVDHQGSAEDIIRFIVEGCAR